MDDIRLLLGLCTALLAFASVVLIVMTIAQSETEMYNDSDWRRGRFARLTVHITLIVFAITLTLLPSTKQMAALKVIPVIVNSDAAKEISSDTKELYKLGIDALKEKLTETHSNKE